MICNMKEREKSLTNSQFTMKVNKYVTGKKNTLKCPGIVLHKIGVPGIITSVTSKP